MSHSQEKQQIPGIPLQRVKLGQIANEPHFSPLFGILESVEDMPVHQFVSAASTELRELLKQEAAKIGQIHLFLSFIVECEFSAEEGAFEKIPLDSSLLFSPLDVKPFPVHEKEPPFCAEDGWMDECIEDITFGLNAAEEEPDRVQPMALIRCSRGGKTRVLKELNASLRDRLPG